MNILLSGGTGFIGRHLAQDLAAAGHKIIVLVRSLAKVSSERAGVIFEPWPKEGQASSDEPFRDIDVVVNLAGESIAKGRWTKGRMKILEDSRIKSTGELIKIVEKSSNHPKIFINASAVGYYGNCGEDIVTENYSAGDGFLSRLCILWEKEALRAQRTGARVISLRMGVVLGKGGGALAPMVWPFKFYFGGPLGSGRQWFPWIHIKDVIRAIQFILLKDDFAGPVNLTSPEPVTMAGFCYNLGGVLRRPSWLPVPEVGLKILFGEMASLFLDSQRVIPERLSQQGFTFDYPDIQGALKDIFSKESRL